MNSFFCFPPLFQSIPTGNFLGFVSPLCSQTEEPNGEDDIDALNQPDTHQGLIESESLINWQTSSGCFSRITRIATPKEKKERARALIEDNLKIFTSDFEEYMEGAVNLLKKDLYHSIDALFEALSEYYCLEKKSILDMLEELVEKGHMTSTGAEDLKQLIIFRNEFRQLIYQAHERKITYHRSIVR